MTIQAPRTVKFVYRFDEGDASMADLLGGKGSNLCEMARLGLPVPPGFVISTQVCRDFLTKNQALPEGLEESIKDNIQLLEKSMSVVRKAETQVSSQDKISESVVSSELEKYRLRPV